MKLDPANKEDSLSSPSDPEHAPLVVPSCLTPENWLNIFNSIADPVMLLDNDYISFASSPGRGTRGSVTLAALSVENSKES